jgi:hypothetical protein
MNDEVRRKITWTYPEGKSHNQIDHVLIDIDDIEVYLMSDISGQQIVMLTPTWWWQSYGEAGQ